MDSLTILIVLAGVLAILAAAACTVALNALTTLTRTRVAALADVRPNAARRLAQLLDRREDVLQALLLTRMLVLAAATIAGVVVSGWAGGTLWQVITVAVLAPVLHVVTVALPRAWALGHAPQAASVASVVANAATVPPLWLGANVAQRLAAKLVPAGTIMPAFGLEELAELAERAEGNGGGDAEQRSEGSEQANGRASDSFDGYDGRTLLSSVVAFGRTVTREVMVPRPDMVTLRAALSVEEAWRIADEERYSRYPVEGENVDDIVGVVYAKDLLHAGLDGRVAETVADLMHDAWFVPETKRVASLLREMQRDKVHLAVVIDEYGGTAGLVTLEDVLEELVGEISDEFDEEEPPLAQRLEDGRVRLDARLLVEDANQYLGRPLPQGHWDTVAGLVFATLGHIPDAGEIADVGGQSVEVERVVGRRIETVLVGDPQ
ncbi:MAG: magnesium and cobalt exporter, family [Acidimicrobiia bacterium]|jgi:CBS domain containing-hemolysin-like protein|nr:magnesium and cobalt exporter, family [Acidimicrobiia bacterium]